MENQTWQEQKPENTRMEIGPEMAAPAAGSAQKRRTGKLRLSIHELTAIAMMSAVLALLAQIAIPLGPVPFTLQTVGLIALTLILPRKSALICIFVYLLLGAVGLPVFSGGQSGPGILAGPTGGFLFGFLPGALLGIQVLGRQAQPHTARFYLAALTAILLCFGWGTVHFSLVMGVTLKQAFFTAALPFLPIDGAKILLFTPLFRKIRRQLHSQFPQLF